ncbi:DUF4175 domain-containing protein [Luteimonas yindakuii]|uniref:DUF4175 domain-containing protein n=1 Tax=Luteimonas yindakuii TaxID=2565782 RepID=UPI0011078848|nr:DUF4175 domain-containing protein [Luteimonas yindakuii]QCO67301.2 DUF4175 domain-containing protein [Luteimonas yindakuii]
MTAPVRMRWRQARTHVVLVRLLLGLPWLVAAAVLGWRLGGSAVAVVVALLAGFGLVVAVVRVLRTMDQAWLASALDARRTDMDDSAALLFADPASLRPLQQLQRARLEERLRVQPPPDLRAPWPWRALALSWGVAAGVFALLAWWPFDGVGRAPAGSAQDATVAATAAPRLQASVLRIEPPTYTGLDAQTVAVLDAKAPAGSLLTWRLRIAPQPAAVELEFLDGERLALQREGDHWIATQRLQRSRLYRLRIAGAAEQPPPPLHRLDAVADRAPQVRVLEPEATLQLRVDGQRQWRLVFEASDDHGVAAQARLRIVRTEGSGENQTFHEHVRTLAGQGAPRLRRYATTLEIADFGLQPGEDLVARLEVSDLRQPQPQAGRSASVILRWPPPAPPDVAGLEGLARQVLPAYFRSQRQIIIDAEALIAERAQLDTSRFQQRSDSLGVDQRLLRLRYGQFLGEESEGAPQAPPVEGHDRAPPPPRPAVSPGGIFADGSDALPPAPPPGQQGQGHDHDTSTPTRADADGDDHDHADGAPADGVFGRAGDVVAAFGHTHDIPEAATLLDPKTRETLRRALGEMWQSELHLRQADPSAALPYANRALELIKQVQESDRIYLARVGAQLPPIDEGRRLGGDREGLASRGLPSLATPAAEARLHEAWWALGDAAADPAPVLDTLQAWPGGARLDDPLALVAAIDAVRNDPACSDCRDTLRGLLWQAMRRPAGGIAPRVGDDTGARYLRALRDAAEQSE